jgi:hypothetical protein
MNHFSNVINQNNIISMIYEEIIFWKTFSDLYHNKYYSDEILY